MFSIKKNYKLDKLVQIFEENNQGFVYDKDSILNDEFIKFVCTKNNEPVGYLVLYPKSDFAVKDGYDISVQIPENSVYIWHLITQKGYERQGVATALINHIKQEYKNFNIYSILDEHNTKSDALHKKLGFLPVDTFKKAYADTLDTYTLVQFKAE